GRGLRSAHTAGPPGRASAPRDAEPAAADPRKRRSRCESSLIRGGSSAARPGAIIDYRGAAKRGCGATTGVGVVPQPIRFTTGPRPPRVTGPSGPFKGLRLAARPPRPVDVVEAGDDRDDRSEEHTSELQSRE